MKKELIRIGTNALANAATLDKRAAFDLLFGDIHKFVYVRDYAPAILVNGTWTGVFGHLINDHKNGLEAVGMSQNAVIFDELTLSAN